MSADYPGAVWLPAHISNFRQGRSQNPTLIIIHVTDGHARAQPVAEMWQEPSHGTSAHFVVGQQGEVFQAVRLVDTAWHAHTVNGISVGVEHCARSPGEWGKGDTGLPPSDDLYEASAKLVAWLCTQLGVQPSRVCIMGHAEADANTTHSDCPNGCGWDWSRYMTLVVAEFQKLQAVA